jgi:hypothetical protein
MASRQGNTAKRRLNTTQRHIFLQYRIENNTDTRTNGLPPPSCTYAPILVHISRQQAENKQVIH